jgi:hypothetical protein
VSDWRVEQPLLVRMIISSTGVSDSRLRTESRDLGGVDLKLISR